MRAMEEARKKYADVAAETIPKKARKASVPEIPPLTLQYGGKAKVIDYKTKKLQQATFVSRTKDHVFMKKSNGDTKMISIKTVPEYKFIVANEQGVSLDSGKERREFLPSTLETARREIERNTPENVAKFEGGIKEEVRGLWDNVTSDTFDKSTMDKNKVASLNIIICP